MILNSVTLFLLYTHKKYCFLHNLTSFFSSFFNSDNKFLWPSGHSGGFSHLSTSRCCSTKLYPFKLITGRHQQWCQMLLHKPVVSQHGHYSIRQTAFSTWYGKKQHRQKTCFSAIQSENNTLALSPVCLRSICECVCGYLCPTLFNFSTLGHTSLCELPPEPWNQSLAIWYHCGFTVVLKCPRPNMSSGKPT